MVSDITLEVRIGPLCLTQAGLERAGTTMECPALPVLPEGRAVFRDVQEALGVFSWAVRRFTDQPVSLVSVRVGVTGGDVLEFQRRAEFVEREEHEADEAERRRDAKRGRADT